MADFQAFIGVTSSCSIRKYRCRHPDRLVCRQRWADWTTSKTLALLREKRASVIRQYLKYRLHYLKAAMG